MQVELRRALAVFCENGSASDAELLAALWAAGIERNLAIAIIQFMPAAFMRVQFRESGPIFSDKYTRVCGNQSGGRKYPLASEPVFNTALEIARAGVSREEMLAVLRWSPEYVALAKALNAGEQLVDMVVSPIAVFADFGRSDEGPNTPARARKWWRFWERAR